MEEMTTLQQAYYHLKKREFGEARKLFDLCLCKALEPSAYIGRLLSDNGLREESELPLLPCPLSSYEDFLAAYDCGGKGYRQTLSDYENEQKRLLEKKEENYRALVAGMERETFVREELEMLWGKAVELNGYKDSKERKEEISRQLEKLEEEEKKKNKKKKKILIPVFSLVFLGILVFGVFSSFPKVNGVRYALTVDGFVAVSCEEEQKEIVLEERVHGIRVTGLSKNAFRDRTNLERAVLHSGIKTIGSSAFNGCTALKEVQEAEGVLEVGGKAFKDCVSLKILRLHEGCLFDKKDSFKNCEGLGIYLGEEKLPAGAGNQK